jgi:hypothetical protein
MSNQVNNKEVVVSLKTYYDLVDKLNRDSEDMFYSLDIENREEEISQEQYQALLVHHLIITSSNLASDLTDHLHYLIKKVEEGEEMTRQDMVSELQSMIGQIDNYTFAHYPPNHFEDVKEFVDEIAELRNSDMDD